MIKKKAILIGGAGVFLALSVACSSNKTAENTPVKSGGDGTGTAPASTMAKRADKALVRFVNGTTESKDLTFGDLTPFTGVDSFDVTRYKELPADRHDFKLFTKDQKANSLATNSEGLTTGKHYTILAFTDKSGKVTLDPVMDDLTPPEAGMAKVRVINLAPSMKNADLYVRGKKDPLISGAGLDDATGYKDVAPAEANLYLRNSMSKKNAVRVEDTNLTAGKLYTILVFQDKHGKVKVKTIEDEFTAS